MNTFISAVQHIRPLRGGAQSHLLRASDGNCYVTKFQNNPQHIRVLANEMFATRLGLRLGLPMPQVEVIEVSSVAYRALSGTAAPTCRLANTMQERQTIGIALCWPAQPRFDVRLLAE